MDVLDEISEPALRVYRVMTQVAERGICKANQRELTAMLGMSTKTLIPARDELVKAGLIERIMHYRGRRDWYRIIPSTTIDAKREQIARAVTRNERAKTTLENVTRQTTLFTDSDVA
jgi:DNA-binding MarR family transcriptional regulator